MTVRDIVKLFEDMEARLIASFRRNLERHRAWERREGFSWPAWQALKLRDLQRFRRENTALLRQYAPVLEAETETLLREQYSEGARQAQAELAGAGTAEDTPGPTPIPDEHFFGVNDERLTALVADMQKSERAACTATLRTMDDVYRQTILRAETALSAGAVTLPQALDMAAKDFLARGVTSITYANGRRVNIVSYAEMALRTAATRSFLRGEAARRAAYGVDTVLMSQYGACSKTCLPWQGRVYIDDVWGAFAGEVNGKRGKSANGSWYPLLSVAIEGGAFHPNCRHTLSTWVEGVSRLPPPMDEARVRAVAALEQRQRALEREVRRMKRLAEGTLEPVTAEGYAQRVKEEAQRLRGFVREHGDVLRRAPWREQTYGLPLENASERAILKENRNTEPMAVTNAAMQRVPIVRPRGCTQQQAKLLRKRHRELLRLAQAGEPGAEWGMLLDGDFHPVETVRGESGALRVQGISRARYLAHNHPSGQTFSMEDVENLAFAEGLRGISVVGNNGAVYFLSKAEDFSAAGFANDIARRCAQQPDYKASPERYLRFMEELLEGGKRYGFHYERR